MATKHISKFAQWGKKIVAVGRNYKEHAAELGNALPSKPLLFMKPASSYLEEGAGPILLPLGCSELHHEVELAVVIGTKCCDVLPQDVVSNHVAGYALALDMTARDFQNEAKKTGGPWEMAKCFDTALPISRFLTKDEVGDAQSVALWCKVNGELRQNASTRDMVFDIPILISYISRYFTLEPGDVVLTGTPAGVGPVKAGDVITAGMGSGTVEMKFQVSSRSPRVS